MALITFSWILDLLIILTLSVWVLYTYITRNHDYWKNRGVKSVPGTSVFGDFFDCLFAKKPLRDHLRDMYLLGGDEKFIGFYVLDKPFLILRDPEAIKNVLVKDFKNFSNRMIAPNHSDYIGSVNIFTLKNPAWKVLRQKLSPVFTSSKLRNMFDMMLETGGDLEKQLQALVSNDDWNVIDVKDLCEKFTTDVIGLTMFGMKFNALNNPNAEFRNEGKKHFKSSYSRYFSLLSMFFTPRLTKLLDLTMFDPDVPTFLRRVLPEAMAERIQAGGKRNDLLDTFIELKENHKDESDELHYYFQDDGLVGTSIVFLTGGFEPSASLMYLILYELSKKPEIQNRLRKEIKDALAETNGKITYDMAMSLPYLDMVTSEGLRKYPLLHFLDREAEEDYEFPDTKVVIEKGTPIVIPMSGIHMDPKYFPNPEDFDPERFSPENKRKILPFTYFPFGEGPRNCIGMRIGLIQAKVGLIYLISQYEVSPCQETPIPLEYDSYTIFTKSRTDMKLNMRRAKN